MRTRKDKCVRFGNAVKPEQHVCIERRVSVESGFRLIQWLTESSAAEAGQACEPVLSDSRSRRKDRCRAAATQADDALHLHCFVRSSVGENHVAPGRRIFLGGVAERTTRFVPGADRSFAFLPPRRGGLSCVRALARASRAPGPPAS